MSHKRPVWIVWLLAAVVLVVFPADALAAGNDVGKTVGVCLFLVVCRLSGWHGRSVRSC